MGIERWGFFRLFEHANWTIRKMRDGSEILPRTWSGIRRFWLGMGRMIIFVQVRIFLSGKMILLDFL